MVDRGSIRVLPGTAPPWVWTGWGSWFRREVQENRYQYRRLRPGLRMHQLTDLSKLRDWQLQSGARVAGHGPFFTPYQIRQFDSWGTGEDRSRAVPTLRPSWVSDGGSVWKPWPDVTHIKLEPRPTQTHVGKPKGPGPEGWMAASEVGLPLGFALIATFLLILRAVDKCIHNQIFKMTRRWQSEEWETPNVMATSNNFAVRETPDLDAGRPPSPTHHDHRPDQVDFPPPYSVCADPSPPHNKPDHEEPPPPYSTCYVTYSNPKDELPSVHFFTRQCQNLFANYEAGPSNVHDTGQSVDVATSNESRIHVENETATEQIGVVNREVMNQETDELPKEANSTRLRYVLVV